jgi:hypothetical protein
LKKASEEYYFVDREQISWRVLHDVCVDMQNMSICLVEVPTDSNKLLIAKLLLTCASTTHQGILITVPIGGFSDDSGSHYDPRFDDLDDLATDNVC